MSAAVSTIDLHALVAAVREAGAVTLKHRAAGVTAGLKSDRSLVTAADQEAEAVILTALADLAPDVPVVAEEESAAGRQPAPGPRFFLVDALDGTREFVGGGDDFTVNVALVENGVPLFGIVHAPASDRLAWGDVGLGEAWTGTGDGWRRIVPLAGTSHARAVASRSAADRATAAYLDACGAGECLSIGSSLKFLLLAEGEAGLYPRPAPTMEWDTAAGDAVLRAAGGMTFGLDGKPLAYGKPHYFNPGFVATGGGEAPPLAPFYPNPPTRPGHRG